MDRDAILAAARQAVTHEARALDDLAAALDDSFVAAVDTLFNAKGRVIVTGIGKSGHIARKIAATFASTGTPAHFVHPAEASHGDLGMVTRDDVVLAISYSGEAPELSDIIAFSGRFDIPLIALSGRAESTLARQSDIALILPPATEACPTGVVPTTSTTMTLAMGDALAIALMDQRSFTAEHFREYHPGGKLGARLSRVRDLMHDDTPLVTEATAMPDALVAMTGSGYGMVGVTDAQGRLTGIVTDGDLRRHMAGLMEARVTDVMTPNPKTIGPDQLAAEALAEMNRNNITCLLVVDPNTDRQAVGIIRVHDCMRAGLV